MTDLILTILCSTTIALMLKFNDIKKGNSLVLLYGNYLIATIIALFLFFIETDSTYSVVTFAFGAIIGIMFVFSFFAFIKAVNIAGTAIAVLSSRLSLIVPILLSFVVYAERPNLYQSIGFIFTFITLGFFYLSLKTKKSKTLKMWDYIYLFGVLLGMGLADFSMKVFEQFKPASEKSFFLFSIFIFSFLYSLGYSLLKKNRFENNTFIRGNILGIPNIFSSFFLIATLSQFKAIIVYPIVNISVIIITAISAYILWNDKVNKYGIIALLFGAVAIILLSLSK
ncbi:EamA family transporter [Bacteroidota bacterium]